MDVPFFRIRASHSAEPKLYRWFVYGTSRSLCGYTWTKWGARRAARRAIERQAR